MAAQLGSELLPKPWGESLGSWGEGQNTETRKTLAKSHRGHGNTQILMHTRGDYSLPSNFEYTFIFDHRFLAQNQRTQNPLPWRFCRNKRILELFAKTLLVFAWPPLSLSLNFSLPSAPWPHKQDTRAPRNENTPRFFSRRKKKLSSNSESEPIGELGGCKIRATATSFLSQDAENNNNSCTFFQVPQGKQKQSSSWRQQEGEREKTRRRKQANALLLSRRFSPTDLCATTLQYRDREHFWMRNANAAHFRRIPLPRWRSSPFQNQKNTGAETCDEFYRGKFDRK